MTLAQLETRHSKKITHIPRYQPHPSPIRTVDANEHSQRLALRGHGECPQCGKTVVAAAVVREAQEPLTEPLAGYTGPCVLFKMFCDHCDHIVTRLRACDPNGNNLGEWIGAHGLIKDQRRVNVFLRLHPEARGVLQ